MPPKIHRRTIQIEDTFVDAMLAYYTEWLQGVERLLRDRPALASRFNGTIQRLFPIVRRQSPGQRVGLDYEITRLRGLPYKRFFVYHLPEHEINFLAGETHHVTLKDWKTHELMGELGSYTVFIPTSMARQANLDSLHMVPMRNPRSAYRHPHHYLRHGEIEGHPLTTTTGNCFGSYGGVLKGLMDEPDIPELFRQLYGHLSTYGHIPPIRMHTLDFDHDTPEAA